MANQPTPGDGFRGPREAKDKRQFFSTPLLAGDVQQICWTTESERPRRQRRKAAELIIGNIDDNGFLQSTPKKWR